MRTLPVRLAFICIWLYFVCGGCSVNTTPEVPSWDAEFNVPLGTETTYIADWVDDSDNLVENPSGIVAFRFEGDLDRAEIGDRLTVDPFAASYHPTLGVFELRDPARQQTRLQFGELWPPSQYVDGQSVPVPGFEFLDLESPVPELDGFESMTLEEGALTVFLTNTLPVAVDNVHLALVDESSSQVVVSMDFPFVGAGERDSSVADLAGATLTSRLRVRAGGGSPGSWEPVLIDTQSGVAFEVVLGGLKAVAASAELPATGMDLDETVDIPGGMIVTEAEIGRGVLHLRFDSGLPVDLDGSLEIEELHSASGVPLVVRVDIPAYGTAASDVPLDGYTLTAAAPAPGTPQVLSVRAGVMTRDTGEIVTVEAGDGMTVAVELDTLAFHRVSGILDGTTFEIPAATQDVDVPDGLEDISLREARLTLRIASGIAVPAYLSLEAVGQSDKGTVVTLPIEIELGAAPKSQPDTATVVLDQDNSTLVDFMNNLPRTVTVGGRARVGDGVTQGTVSEDDYVEGGFTFEVPLHLAFEEQVIETNLTEIEILPENGDADGGDNAVDGELSRRMKSAQLWVTFVNHTPLGAVITASFAADSARVYTEPELALDPVELDAGTVDDSGAVVEAAVSANTLCLTDEDMDLFRNPGDGTKIVYLGARIRLLSTEGRAVKVTGSDYFQTQARIRFTATVDMPEEK